MGRYWQVQLKDKSQKNIHRVNQILKDEFDVQGEIYEDGYQDEIFKSNKWFKEEFNYVKNINNYNQFYFSQQIKQKDLTLKVYKSILLPIKNGTTFNFKISAMNEDERQTVFKIAQMVYSDKYKNLFNLEKIDDFETIKQYCGILNFD